MAKFALFNDGGMPLAFYDSIVHGNAIPDDAVEITTAQWLEFLEHQGWRRWNGSGVEVIPGEPEEE